MDAKPQRPLRAIRVRDENQAPAVAGKSLHQRNKSTPALSTLMQAGALKAGAGKRTAFADVSNLSRNVQSSKDDMQLAGKKSFKELPLPSIKETSKPAALLRPAQRPLPSISLKNASNASDPVTSLTSIPVAAPTQPHAVPRKPLTKRATTIFREPQPQIAEPIAAPLQDVAPVLSLPSFDPEDLLPRELELDDEVINAPINAVEEVAKLPEMVSFESIASLLEPADIEPVEVKKETITDALSVVHDEHHHVIRDHSAPSLHDLVDIPEKVRIVERTESSDSDSITHSNVESEYKVVPVEPQDGNYLDALEHQALLQEEERYEEVARSVAIPTIPEDEYWVEEEEEEYYDADGYTTARSFRSRGDNTTGLTILLEPRVTHKTQQELAAAKTYVEDRRTTEDIEDEQWDTSMVAEYSDEIFEYMQELEEKMRPNANYMDIQGEIQWSMRSVLMDWLVQVHHRFNLLPETLFLAVNYVDRFLSKKPVSLGKLQLVGATAIFLAAKYEEINCPSVNEIVYMVDGGYNVEEILKAERFMLNMLNFELGWPGPMSFLRKVSKADDYDLETRTLAKYFLEVTIMDERFVASIPSFLAAGAHCLSRFILKKGDWSLHHVHYSGFTYAQLRPLVATMLECCEDPTKHHQAIFEKYSHGRYKRASLYVAQEVKQGFELPSISKESSWRRL